LGFCELRRRHHVHGGRFRVGAFAAAPAPERRRGGVYEPPPLTKRFGFLNQKDPDPEQVEREAVKRDAETHELFHGKLELIEELALIKQLEQPAAEKRWRLKALRAEVAPASTQTIILGPKAGDCDLRMLLGSAKSVLCLAGHRRQQDSGRLCPGSPTKWGLTLAPACCSCFSLYVPLLYLAERSRATQQAEYRYKKHH
jgi:hypothetical protein